MTTRQIHLITSKLLIISSLFLFSCFNSDTGSNQFSIPGMDGPYVFLDGDKLMITAVLETLQIEGGGRFPIPKYPNSYIEISPDLQTGGTMLAYNISTKDIFGELEQLDPQTLPGGRNLPGVIGGTLPASAFKLEILGDMTVYLGPSIFGLFIPMEKIGMDGAIASFKFYSDGTRAGNLSIVGADQNGENSGILLLLNLDTTLAKYVQYATRKYR